MKHKIFFLSLLCGWLSHAQQPGELDKKRSPFTNIPSPDAYQITKYGDNPINEFNGMVTTSIPIYTYKVKGITVPVFLSYNGAGVRVDDLSSWTGINWALQAGGAITRSVSDMADEIASTSGTRKFYATPLTNGGISEFTPQAQSLVENVLLDYDTEVDIFSYSFGRESGSFFLDENMVPVIIKQNSPTKIAITGSLLSSKEFVITTSDGMKYYFGGTNATEESTQTIHGSTATTAFYLRKIVHPINGSVEFEYDTTSEATTRTLSMEYYVNSLRSQEWDSSVLLCSATNQPDQYGTTANVQRIINPKYLKRIYSVDTAEQVLFNSTAYTNDHIKRVLHSIEVKNGSQLIHKADLAYYGLDDFTRSTRFFLTKVQLNKDAIGAANGSGQRNEEYKLAYDNLAYLPPRFSFSQDFLGYYNGKHNTTLLPNTIEFPASQYPAFADRSPDFNKAKTATLTHVYYPMGGYTQYEYESIPVKKMANEGLEISTYSNFFGDSQLTAQMPYYDPEENRMKFDDIIPFNQTVDIKLMLSADSNTSNHRVRVKLKITDLSNATAPVEYEKGIGYQTAAQYTFSHTFLANRKYKVDLEIIPAVSSGEFRASVYFPLQTGFKKVGGYDVRVKRQTDYAESGTPSLIKRYYYNKYDELAFPADSLGEMPRPIYDYQTIKRYFRDCPGQWTNQAAVIEYYGNLNSKALNQIHGETGGTQAYEYVTISYGGDNFEQGGKQKRFKFQIDANNAYNNQLMPSSTGWVESIEIYETGRIYAGRKTNHSVFNGTLLEEIDFKKENNALYKIKKEEYTYTYTHVKTWNNVVGHRAWELAMFPDTYNGSNTMFNIFIGQYATFAYRYDLIDKKTTDYIENTPMTVADESNYKKVKTEQHFEYGSLIGLPTKITSTNSRSTNVLETRNYYVNQATSLTGFTAPQLAACSALLSKNQVGVPIQTESYKNGQLLTAERTLYKVWNGNNNLVLPEVIQSSKRTPMQFEDQIVYMECDNRGNLTMARDRDWVRSKRIYNANNDVIVKIEAFSGNLDPNTDPVGSNPCDLHAQFPTSDVTVFKYDPLTKLVIEMVDPNCEKASFEYDALGRLKRIKDKDGTTISENDNNFKKVTP